MLRAFSLLLAVVAVAACGASSRSTSSSSAGGGAVPENQQNAQRYTAKQIIAALRLVKDPNNPYTPWPGNLWDPQTGGTVDVVLTTPSEIRLYVSAGDPVATNPSRTAGVKYGWYQGRDPSAVYRVFTRRLAALK